MEKETAFLFQTDFFLLFFISFFLFLSKKSAFSWRQVIIPIVILIDVYMEIILLLSSVTMDWLVTMEIYNEIAIAITL